MSLVCPVSANEEKGGFDPKNMEKFMKMLPGNKNGSDSSSSFMNMFKDKFINKNDDDKTDKVTEKRSKHHEHVKQKSYLLTPNTSSATTTTNACTKPAIVGRPLVQFVVVVDAGSTGSRVHIVKFNNCAKTPQAENEDYYKIEPGLSSYAADNNLQAAAESIRPLLMAAMKAVPPELHSSTPIAVKATAGLRLLPSSTSQHILDAVRAEIAQSTKFQIVKKDGVSIMSGDMEGVYSWWTVNMLLGNVPGYFNATNNNDGTSASVPEIGQGGKRSFTATTLEMGGASTQLTFKPDSTLNVPSKYIHQLKTENGQTHGLYMHSYLGYGQVEARNKAFRHIASQSKSQGGTGVVSSSCFGPGFASNTAPPTTSDSVTRNKSGSQSPRLPVTIVGRTNEAGRSSFDRCYQEIKPILNLNKPCFLNSSDSANNDITTKSCSFDGQFQPGLQQAHPNRIYMLSKFYDTLYPFIYPQTTLTIEYIKSVGQALCSSVGGSSSNDTKGMDEDKGLKQKLQSRKLKGPKNSVDKKMNKGLEKQLSNPYLCLDIVYLTALLLDGFKVDPKYELSMAETINGFRTGWVLGAAMDIVTTM
ncbi:Guanosine-diphosphatase [Mycoemilia scoparia]|uniref:guanosine-diphosphatase n=1 Tax=Mycoemilia scoparia TaxID=417184 RepID=A0A9W7ZQW9_9FUNG|nr:Guanosine-diphosphatase [Mycoemilia scoparia]